MQLQIFYFIAFGCFGMATEIFFNAIRNALINYREIGKIDWALHGKSYIWMFPIYGMISVLFPFIYSYLKDFNLIGKLLMYTIIIFLIEFSSGWLLKLLTGKCPWDYKTKWAIKGYIRLDYAPFWMLFAYIVENVYLNLVEISAGHLL